MIYTHTFEITAGGVTVEGEIGFDHGEQPAFKTNASEEMTVQQHRRIQMFLELLVDVTNKFTDVEKIELVKK